MSTIDLSKYKQIADKVNVVKNTKLSENDIIQLSAQTANERVADFKAYLKAHIDNIQSEIEDCLSVTAYSGSYKLSLIFSCIENPENQVDPFNYIVIRDSIRSAYIISYAFDTRIQHDGYSRVDNFIKEHDLKNIVVLCYRAFQELLKELGLESNCISDESLIYTNAYPLYDNELYITIPIQ